MSTEAKKRDTSGRRVESRAADVTAGRRPEGAGGLIAGPPFARERIQTRAYEIFQARKHNGGGGDATSDWLQAERELTPAADRTGRSGVSRKGVDA